MSKKEWRSGNMLYPLPAVLITSRNQDGRDNVCTVAWAGTVCSDPAMVSISLRKSRLSYDYVKATGVYVINLTTEALAWATDYCGVRSGKKEDKFETAHLTKEEAKHISCSMIAESPVNIECMVREVRDLGSHTMFIAEVVAVHIDEQYLDENGRFSLGLARPLVYSHGEYYGTGSYLGKFGYSVEKKKSGGRHGARNKNAMVKTAKKGGEAKSNELHSDRSSDIRKKYNGSHAGKVSGNGLRGHGSSDTEERRKKAGGDHRGGRASGIHRNRK